MLAIYKDKVYRIGEDTHVCQLLDRDTGLVVLTVDYGDDDLVVDPTDEELVKAEHPHWQPTQREAYAVVLDGRVDSLFYPDEDDGNPAWFSAGFKAAEQAKDVRGEVWQVAVESRIVYARRVEDE